MAGKFKYLTKHVAGKSDYFLHWTKNSKIVEERKLFEKIQNSELTFLIFFFFLQVYDFRSITDSVFTLFRMILGDFNFKAIESASTFLGPVYFLSYIFFVFFVLLVKKIYQFLKYFLRDFFQNMFLAIINDTYAEVKMDVKSRKADFQIGDFFKTGVNNVKCFFGILDR